MNRTALRVLLPATAVVLPLALSGPARADTVYDKITLVGQHLYGDDKSGYEAVFEIRNDSQEPTTIGGTVDFLNAAGASVANGPAYFVSAENELLPGKSGFIKRFTAATGVTAPRLTITGSAPPSQFARLDYYSLSAAAPVVTHPSTHETDYSVTITNTGTRPASGVSALGVIRDASGAILDVESTKSVTGDLAPGASSAVTYTAYDNIGFPPGTPVFEPHGQESSLTSVDGRGVVSLGGKLKTTWTLTGSTTPACASVPVHIVQFSATAAPVDVAKGTTNSKGVVQLDIKPIKDLSYTLLVDGSASCAAARVSDFSLEAPVTVHAAVPSKAVHKQSFTVKGKTIGAVKGDVVQVQYKSKGKWVTVTHTRVKGDGSYKVGVKLPKAGKTGVRIYVPPTALHLEGKSQGFVVKVS